MALHLQPEQKKNTQTHDDSYFAGDRSEDVKYKMYVILNSRWPFDQCDLGYFFYTVFGFIANLFVDLVFSTDKN